VIPFRTMLTDLASETQANRNYQKSDLLQIIRILKNYDLLRDPRWSCLSRSERKSEGRMTNPMIGSDERIPNEEIGEARYCGFFSCPVG